MLKEFSSTGKGSRFVEPDRNSYDDEIEADAVRATGRNGREGDRDRYNYRPEQKQRGPRGSSSGGPSTGMNIYRAGALYVLIKGNVPMYVRRLCGGGHANFM